MLDIPYVNEVECKKANKFVCEVETKQREKEYKEITSIKTNDLKTHADNHGQVKVERHPDKAMICRVDEKESALGHNRKPPQFRYRELECKETEIGENVSW